MAAALMLSSRSPYPLTAGFRMRIHYLARSLSREYDVDLLCLQHVPPTDSPFRRIIPIEVPRTRFAFQASFHWPLGYPLQIGGYRDRRVHGWIHRNGGRYDLLYVHHIRMAPYADVFRGRKVLDYHDAISLHYREGMTQGAGYWKFLYRAERERLLRWEIRALEGFDGAFINGEVDRQYLLRHAAHRRRCPIEVLPMGIRDEVLSYPSTAEIKRWIVMIGRMGYYPNEDGAVFFAREVYPLLRRHIPDAEFWVVGADPTRRVKQLERTEGVHVTGYVADPWTYLAQARIVVAPIRLGAGIQNKVLEAMALGKAVVATPLAVRGIEASVNGRHFLVAVTPHQMATSILEAWDNVALRKEIGENASRLVRDHYTWDKIGKDMLMRVNEWRRKA